MWNKTPYGIVKSRYITEKSLMLEQLKDRDSNPSLARCQSPKYVFLVDMRANKRQIADAVEEIYAERSVRVVSVNTVRVKPKPRRVRGRSGMTAGFKKAVVTLQPGDLIE
jgi:large subunit ribosomal protein L23